MNGKLSYKYRCARHGEIPRNLIPNTLAPLLSVWSIELETALSLACPKAGTGRSRDQEGGGSCPRRHPGLERNIKESYHTASRDDRNLPYSVDRAAEAKWFDRLVGAGSLLTLLYVIAYLLLNHRYLSLRHPAVLILHLICAGLYAAAAVMTLNVGPWVRSHWKQVCFSFSTTLIAAMTAITILTGQTAAAVHRPDFVPGGNGPFPLLGGKDSGAAHAGGVCRGRGGNRAVQQRDQPL